MGKAWHYAWAGKSEGPVDEVMMADLIRAGRVRADSLVWAEGMAQWEPADRHFAFAPRPFAPQTFASQTPPPPSGPPAMPAYASSPSQSYAGAPARSFTEAVTVCFQKYITFRGRASRSEYWWFALFVMLLGLLGALLEGAMGNDGQALSALISLATFLPSLSVTVRRLHDTNRSGWWIGGFWLAMIPVVVSTAMVAVGMENSGGEAGAMAIIGILGLAVFAFSIAMFVFMVSRGTPGPNRFG